MVIFPLAPDQILCSVISQGKVVTLDR